MAALQTIAAAALILTALGLGAVTLLRACWAYFDDVAARVSPEMRRGPRGGGRRGGNETAGR